MSEILVLHCTKQIVAIWISSSKRYSLKLLHFKHNYTFYTNYLRFILKYCKYVNLQRNCCRKRIYFFKKVNSTCTWFTDMHIQISIFCVVSCTWNQGVGARNTPSHRRKYTSNPLKTLKDINNQESVSCFNCKLKIVP